MSFDYVKAWENYIQPEFFRFFPRIQRLYNMVDTNANLIHYIDISQNPSAATKELISLFDAFRDREILAYMAEIVYYYGHLSPYGNAQGNGLYWKFKDLATASLSKNPDDVQCMISKRCIVGENLKKYFCKEYSIKDYYHELSI